MCMNKTKDIKGGRIAYAVLLRADDQLCSPWVTICPEMLFGYSPETPSDLSADIHDQRKESNTWVIGKQRTSTYGPGYHSLRTRDSARAYREEMRRWNGDLEDLVIAKVWVSEACEAEIRAGSCGYEMSDTWGYVSRKRIVLEVCDE